MRKFLWFVPVYALAIALDHWLGLSRVYGTASLGGKYMICGACMAAGFVVPVAVFETHMALKRWRARRSHA